VFSLDQHFNTDRAQGSCKTSEIQIYSEVYYYHNLQDSLFLQGKGKYQSFAGVLRGFETDSKSLIPRATSAGLDVESNEI
jgi:hypothetical protein